MVLARETGLLSGTEDSERLGEKLNETCFRGEQNIRSSDSSLKH